MGKVFGVGFNSGGKFKQKTKGRATKEKVAWINMLKRCYYKPQLEVNRTYAGCYVCNDWLDFQKFAKWYSDNLLDIKEGCDLDKDLIEYGNKEYSPEKCMIVPRSVNKFMCNSGASRGLFMIGVNFHKASGLFRSECRNPITKSRDSLGYFDSEIDAHLAWRVRKSEIAIMLSKKYNITSLESALVRMAAMIENFEIYPLSKNLHMADSGRVKLLEQGE